MKYNGREVIDFSIGVYLGKDKICNNLGEFQKNEKFVAYKLELHGIIGWEYVEAPVLDLAIISPNSCTDIIAVNKLFLEVKKIFDKVNIQILYDGFDENGYNLEETVECLKPECFEV